MPRNVLVNLPVDLERSLGAFGALPQAGPCVLLQLEDGGEELVTPGSDE